MGYHLLSPRDGIQGYGVDPDVDRERQRLNGDEYGLPFRAQGVWQYLYGISGAPNRQFIVHSRNPNVVRSASTYEYVRGVQAMS